MRRFPKPRVVVSKCLGLGNCRFDGEEIKEKFIAKLNRRAIVIPFCPEEAAGLVGQRESIRLELVGDQRRFVQARAGADHTEPLTQACTNFLDSLEPVDGFILKSRCATCGFKDVAVFQNGARLGHEKGRGLMGSMVLERFGHLAIEDEGRLTNFRLREHFLTHLFIRAELRELKAKRPTMNALIGFQSRVKLQLMACSQVDMRKLGSITANHDHLPVEQVFDRYEQVLGEAFNRVPRYTSNINVLQHAFGYFKGLTPKEKQAFLAELERYREQKSPLSVPLTVARSYIERFDVKYLREQYFFEPYPEELASIEDSGRGRREEPQR